MRFDSIFGLLAMALAFALSMAKEKLLTRRAKNTYRCMLGLPATHAQTADYEETGWLLSERLAVSSVAGERPRFDATMSPLMSPRMSSLWPLPEEPHHDHRDYIQ